MALSTAVYTILSGNATLAGAVSTRIYPGGVPADATLPLVVYEIGDIQPVIAIGDINSWDEAELVVTVYSTYHSNTETYAGYVRTALDGYTGTVSTEKIDTIIYRGQSPDFEPDWTVGDSPQGIAVFTRTLNFTIIRLT